MKRALIFDCDGVLADTELHGHLAAFNQVWEERGVPWRWSREQYAEKLRIGGGKERMTALFHEPAFLASVRPPADAAGQQALVAAWHQEKTARYERIIASGAIPPRSGIKRLAQAAREAGWVLAVASTSARPSVDAVLNLVVGPELAARFDAVLAGDVVKAKKPAPDIYRLAVERLGVSPEQAVAIEDSNNGLRSAAAAGLAVVVTTSEFTLAEDFTGAALVVSALGDPGGERARVVANPLGLPVGDHVTLADLERIVDARQQR